jgi:hypothetical protein
LILFNCIRGRLNVTFQIKIFKKKGERNRNPINSQMTQRAASQSCTAQLRRKEKRTQAETRERGEGEKKDADSDCERLEEEEEARGGEGRGGIRGV